MEIPASSLFPFLRTLFPPRNPLGLLQDFKANTKKNRQLSKFLIDGSPATNTDLLWELLRLNKVYYIYIYII